LYASLQVAEAFKSSCATLSSSAAAFGGEMFSSAFQVPANRRLSSFVVVVCRRM